MRTAEIKNLSMALEALSRIPGSEPERLSMRIHALLDDILTKEEAIIAEPVPAPSFRSVQSQTAFDDKIPF